MDLSQYNIHQNKFFPNADNWMWNYCTYLGSITLENRNYDMGIWQSEDKTRYSFAIVDGNESGEYHSGSLFTDGVLESHIISWYKQNAALIYFITYFLAIEKGMFADCIIEKNLDELYTYHDMFKMNLNQGDIIEAYFEDKKVLDLTIVMRGNYIDETVDSTGEFIFVGDARYFKVKKKYESQT